jgi:hypothetical protein
MTERTAAIEPQIIPLNLLQCFRLDVGVDFHGSIEN